MVRYTQGMREWLKLNVNKYQTFRLLTNAFNEKFNTNQSRDVIKAYCNRTLKLKSYKCNQTISPYKIGDERKESNGYTYIKVKEKILGCNDSRDGWMLKSKYVYQQHYGKINDDDIVMFLDGNTDNFDINNLKVINRSVLMILARNNYFFKDNVEMQTTAILWAKLRLLLKEE